MFDRLIPFHLWKKGREVFITIDCQDSLFRWWRWRSGAPGWPGGWGRGLRHLAPGEWIGSSLIGRIKLSPGKIDNEAARVLSIRSDSENNWEKHETNSMWSCEPITGWSPAQDGGSFDIDTYWTVLGLQIGSNFDNCQKCFTRSIDLQIF